MKSFVFILLCTLALCIGSAPVWAQGSPYTIEGVTITFAGGGDAAKKREMAVKAATKQGFRQLLKNITQEKDWEHHEDLIITSVDWNTVLEKFVIVEEKNAPKYEVTFNLFYDRNVVRRMLQEFQIPYAESKKIKLLVLPLMDTGTRMLLWEDENAWRKAQESVQSEQGLLSFVLPVGDMDEVTNITAEMVNLGAEDVLLNLAQQYDVDGVIVSRLQSRSSYDGTLFEAENRWYGSDALEPTVVRLMLDGTVGLEGTLASLAEKSHTEMEQAWQQAGVIQLNQQGRIFIRFSPKSAADLDKLTNLLEGFNTVKDVQLRVLNVENSLFQINYFGEPQKLADMMMQNGLEISFQGSLWWVSFKDPNAVTLFDEEING